MKYVLLLFILTACAPGVYTDQTSESFVVDDIPDVISPVDETLRWDHMPLTFEFVDRTCKLYQAKRVRSAMKEIELATHSVITFKEVNESPDITIKCTLLDDCYEEIIDIEGDLITKTERICAHDKGTAQITEADGYIIKHGVIEFFGFSGFAESGYQRPSGFSIGDCGHTTTEIHEILHIFGFGHTSDNESIMYPEETTSVGYTLREKDACIDTKKDIDADIIENLIATYSRSSTTLIS